jgi:hypothetical protein
VKELSPMMVTERGRQIDCNDAQRESAFVSIRLSFDPDSNVNDESEEHDEKEFSERNSTKEGTQTDRNDEKCTNKSAPISYSFEWNSNAIN